MIKYVAARNRLPPGSSRLACFPQPKKGFVCFVGFVTIKSIKILWGVVLDV